MYFVCYQLNAIVALLFRYKTWYSGAKEDVLQLFAIYLTAIYQRWCQKF